MNPLNYPPESIPVLIALAALAWLALAVIVVAASKQPNDGE